MDNAKFLLKLPIEWSELWEHACEVSKIFEYGFAKHQLYLIVIFYSDLIF